MTTLIYTKQGECTNCKYRHKISTLKRFGDVEVVDNQSQFKHSMKLPYAVINGRSVPLRDINRKFMIQSSHEN